VTSSGGAAAAAAAAECARSGALARPAAQALDVVGPTAPLRAATLRRSARGRSRDAITAATALERAQEWKRGAFERAIVGRRVCERECCCC